MTTIYFPLTAKTVQTFKNAKCTINHPLNNKTIYDPRATDFDISILDEDKMIAHVLDCYTALCAVQQWRISKEENKPPTKTQQAKNKAFKIAMSVMSQVIRHDDAERPKYGPAISKTIKAFTDQLDGRSWIPLQWASFAIETSVGDLFGVTEEDVQLLHANDPLAFTRCLGPSNPAQILCMQPVTTCRMSLIRYFSICNQKAVLNSNPSLLHVTCEHGEPTLELLQFLLQLHSSQLTKIFTGSDTPLAKLFSRDGCNDELITCLLDIDSSVVAVSGAISSCIYSEDQSTTLKKLDILLKANPEAAGYRFEGCNFLHEIAGAFETAAHHATSFGKKKCLGHFVLSSCNGFWCYIQRKSH